MTTDTMIQFFDGGVQPTLETLGGKGASLVTMTEAGMPVPPGFVITTAAYDAFVESAGIRAHILEALEGLDAEDPAAVEHAAAQIREEICAKPVPDRLRQATRAAFQQLQSSFTAEAPVAVRSSATAEDLPDASFAGQQDTYLWLNGFEAVAEHVRKCWASLYTARAIIYRLKNGIDEEGLSMAVVVQKMVNARVAGVAMTLDPANGDRSKITVDASYGVGESVVSGTVTPDNIKMDKVTLEVVSEHIGDKHLELVPEADSSALVEREVDAERRGNRCLSEDELESVAKMAKRAEKHYGTPQDIEWALDADLPTAQDVVLLQSRPETVHSASKPEPTPSAAPTGALDLSSITSSMLKNFT